MMLSCKETMRLASERLDRRLSLRARLGMRMHLLMCSGCRAVARQLRALDRLIRRRFGGQPAAGPAASPDAGASVARIRRAVHERLAQPHD